MGRLLEPSNANNVLAKRAKRGKCRLRMPALVHGAKKLPSAGTRCHKQKISPFNRHSQTDVKLGVDLWKTYFYKYFYTKKYTKFHLKYTIFYTNNMYFTQHFTQHTIKFTQMYLKLTQSFSQFPDTKRDPCFRPLPSSGCVLTAKLAGFRPILRLPERIG